MARSRGGAAGGDAPRPADRAPAWGRRRPRGRERAAASVQEREEDPEPVADPSALRIPDQPVGPGPSQPPPGLVLTPDLQAAIAQLLGVLGGMQQPPAPATPALVPQDQPTVRAPQVQVPPEGVQLLAADRPMPLEDQKMLGVFLRLTPPRFSWVVGEDSHECLTTYRERLHTFGLVESRGADFIA